MMGSAIRLRQSAVTLSQPYENETAHTIRNDNRVLAGNGFIRHSLGKVNGKQNRIPLSASRIKRGFQQDCAQG